MTVLKNVTYMINSFEIQTQNNLIFQVKVRYDYAIYSKYKLKHKMSPNYAKWVRICIKIRNKTENKTKGNEVK